MNAKLLPPSANDAVADYEDRILEGLEFLRQCESDHRAVAVISSTDPTAVHSLVHRYLATHSGGNVVTVAEPTADAHEFMEAVLTQFGFQTVAASTDALKKLIGLYCRPARADDRPVILAVEQADAFGPDVLAAIADLAQMEIDGYPAMLVVIAGSGDLGRVLDSTGMATISAMTRLRFDLDAGHTRAAKLTPPRQALGSNRNNRELVVSLNGKVVACYRINRERIMIGRSAQNNVSIVNPFVSRHHAMLLTRNGESYVVDLKSKNGTYVNSHPINQHALRDGDVISIGGYELHYVNPSKRARLHEYLRPSHGALERVMASRADEQAGKQPAR